MAHDLQRLIHLEPSNDSVDLTGGKLTYIGNATLLIEYAGIRILTDPSFVRRGEQVDLGFGVSATRLKDPAMSIGHLPPLDAILLSHYHGDHFDQAAERDLDPTLPIITIPAAIEPLEERCFQNVFPLDPWQWIVLRRGDASITITSMPARHGPALVDFAMPDVMGSLLEFRNRPDGTPFRMYLSGDTLAIDELQEIPHRFPEIDLAVLHLGGTRIHGLTVTMDARQGLEVVDIFDTAHILPIHYDDYDVFKSPISEFMEAIAERGETDRVTVPAHGDTYEFSIESPGEPQGTLAG